MSSHDEEAELSALREAIGIAASFSTCLGFTTEFHHPENHCSHLLAPTARDKARDLLLEVLHLGDTASQQTLSSRVNKFVDSFPFSVLLCKKKHGLLPGRKAGQFATQRDYIRNRLMDGIDKYFQSYDVPSDLEEDGNITCTQLRERSPVSQRPTLRGKNDMLNVKVAQLPEPRGLLDPDTSDYSLASPSTASIFSPDDSLNSARLSAFSREVTPSEDGDSKLASSKAFPWTGTLPERQASPSTRRFRTRDSDTPQINENEFASLFDDPEESWLQGLASEDDPPPFSHRAFQVMGKARPRRSSSSDRGLEPDRLPPGNASLKPVPSSRLSPPTSLANSRRRSISGVADVYLNTRDIARSDIASGDTGKDPARPSSAHGTKSSPANSSTVKAKPSKERTESQRLAAATPKKTLQQSLNALWEYGASGTKSTKKNPVCDLLETMREPINKQYDAGWIYAFSSSEAPELLKIGLAKRDAKYNQRSNGPLPGIIKPGHLLTNHEKAHVPRPVISRLSKWKTDCNLDLVTLESFTEIPRGVHKTESLIHKTLHKHSQYVSCQSCKKSHRELFRVDLDEAVSIIGVWRSFMGTLPYGEHGFIREFWQSRCAGLTANQQEGKTVDAWFSDFQRLLRVEAAEVARARKKSEEEEKKRREIEEIERRERLENQLRRQKFGRETALVLSLKRIGTF